MPISMSTAAADLVADPAAQLILRRLNVHVTGTGTPTLVFCNGFNCEQSVWYLVAPALAAQYQLVLFDQAGVGQSDHAASHDPRYATLAGYAQDVVEICQALALREVVLVGHSVGATIALLAAVQVPTYFSKVVLLAASPRHLNAPGYYGGFELSDMQEVLAGMEVNYQAWANTFATMLIGQYQAPELSYALIECASQADPEMAKHIVQLAFLGDYRAQVSLLRCPTLLLQCTDDPAAPAEVSQYLLNTLLDATLITLSTNGHCPHLTAPAEVVHAIQHFLASSVELG